MAIQKIEVSSNIPLDTMNYAIKIMNGYKCIETPHEGVFKVIDGRDGYLVRLDYGRILKLDKKTNTYKMKQDKTIKRVSTEKEALKLKKDAELIRQKRKKGEPVDIKEIEKNIKVTMSNAVEAFKQSERYLDLGDSYQEHYDNYLNHILDYFKEFEPAKITVIDIENYYQYQRTRGNLLSSKKKDGTVNRKMISRTNPKGISVNTLEELEAFLEYLKNN